MSDQQKPARESSSDEFRAVVSRAGALLLLIAAVAAIVLGAAYPCYTWHRNNEELIKLNIAQLGRLKAFVERDGARSPAIDANERTAIEENFLSGPEDALLMAELQTKLRALVVLEKSELSSARTLPNKSVDGLTYLGLKLQLAGGLKEISQIVYNIETRSPFLFVDAARFRVEDQRTVSGSLARPRTPRLIAELDVYGARKPQPPAEPKSVIPR